MGWGGLSVSSPEKGRGSLLSSDLCSQRRGCFRKTLYVEHTALLLGKVNSTRAGAAPAQEVAESQPGLPGPPSSTHTQGTGPVLTGSA